MLGGTREYRLSKSWTKALSMRTDGLMQAAIHPSPHLMESPWVISTACKAPPKHMTFTIWSIYLHFDCPSIDATTMEHIQSVGMPLAQSPGPTVLMAVNPQNDSSRAYWPSHPQSSLLAIVMQMPNSPMRSAISIKPR
jgi:hypothetical protein